MRMLTALTILASGRARGPLPQTRHQRRQHLQVEGQILRDGCFRGKGLKTSEEAYARLKRLQADAMLDNVALKDHFGKQW